MGKPLLLPCPFCGQSDFLVERLDYSASVVICQGMLDEHSACLARGPVGLQDDDEEDQPGYVAAVREWNERAHQKVLATILKPDPEADIQDEGPYMGREAWERLKALPPGTQLFAASGGAQEPACPWIKCNDRMPGDDLDGMAVIVAVVHFKRGLISESDVWVKGSGRADGRFQFWGSNPTHWMPLPKAPAKPGDMEQGE